MKTTRQGITTILLLVVITATAGEVRTWTSKTGTTIDAEFVKAKYDTVYLKTTDGSVKKIKTSNLSKEDQDRIAQLTDPFAAKKAAAAAAAAAQPKASAAMAMADLFGDELRNSREKKVSIDALAGTGVRRRPQSFS